MRDFPDAGVKKASELDDTHLEGFVGGLTKQNSACLASCAAGCAQKCIVPQPVANAAVRRAAAAAG